MQAYLKTGVGVAWAAHVLLTFGIVYSVGPAIGGNSLDWR